MRLPIRLVPRKGHQVGLLLFYVVFAGFSILWTASAAEVVDLDGFTIRWPPLHDLSSNLFPLVGLPFIAVGIGGIFVSLLKMRPNSPNFHLQVHREGLVVKSLFKLRRYEWATLPPFETLRVERRTKNGKRISFYTVATETIAPAPDAPRNVARQREIIRVLADEYGAKNGEADADALTGWFNELRALARDGRLDANETVNVPEGFRDTAISVRAGAMPRGPLTGRSAPVIQSESARTQRSPTVERQ